jgi:hypothetical protein
MQIMNFKETKDLVKWSTAGLKKSNEFGKYLHSAGYVFTFIYTPMYVALDLIFYVFGIQDNKK